jgi:predicted MPP superfamily phosphohydrolase
MTPDPAVAVSSGGGTSGAFCRCLAPPEIGTGLSVELD